MSLKESPYEATVYASMPHKGNILGDMTPPIVGNVMSSGVGNMTTPIIGNVPPGVRNLTPHGIGTGMDTVYFAIPHVEHWPDITTANIAVSHPAFVDSRLNSTPSNSTTHHVSRPMPIFSPAVQMEARPASCPPDYTTKPERKPRSYSPALRERGRSNSPRPVEPYHPFMKAYGPQNVEAFIKQCQSWDRVEDDSFELDTGEKITIRSLKKMFDNNHYVKLEQTYVYSKLVSQYQSLRKGRSSCSGNYGYKDNTASTRVVLARIYKHQRERRRIVAVQPVLEALFSPHYKYPVHVYDAIMTIMIDDMVSFGDLEETNKCKPQKKTVDGNFVGYSGTVRPFQCGTYGVTFIKPFDGSDMLVIYHHLDIDPVKLVQQIILMSEDYCDFHDNVPNSLDRYDWCHWRNWGSLEPEDNEGENNDKFKAVHLDREMNVIYFADANKATELKQYVKKGSLYQSVAIPELYQIVDENQNAIALGTNMKPYNSGDWLYSKVFQDQNTGLNFALVVNCIMGELDAHYGGIPEKIQKRFPTKVFTLVKDTNLQYNMHDFIKN